MQLFDIEQNLSQQPLVCHSKFVIALNSICLSVLREVLLNIEQLHNTKNTFQKLTYPKSKILYVCCQLTPPSCAAEGGRMDGLVSSAAPPQGQMVIGAVSLKLYISAFCNNLPCFAFWLSLLGNVPATCDIASNANADTTLNWHSEPEQIIQGSENQRWHAQRYTPDIAATGSELADI